MSDKKFDWRWLVGGLTIILILITAIFVNTNDNVNNSSNKYLNGIDVDNGESNINWNKYVTTEVILDGSYEIIKSGVYHLTGSIDDGLIAIKTTRDDEVKLILDNVSIKNNSGPAIACYDGNDLVIELIGQNSLEDSENYDQSYDIDIKSAIYSRADTVFTGNGTLNLIANHQDGISSKDDLKFDGGVYNVTAKDDAIRGKDSVYIVDGDFKIKSGADAIKSTNETKLGKGFVLIESGAFDIDSGAKGIKSVSTILIYGGEYQIKSFDDAIHSNGYVGINGGNITIYSGDDGVHADRELIIDKGNLTITKAFEGVESQAITINGGEIAINSTDDGINAGGGADSSANNRPGAGMFSGDTDCVININGGYIHVNSAGDGIDSNGYLFFNSGRVVVDGPTNNKNGALDASLGIVMNGGEVIAVGAKGMAEPLGNKSNIYNISVFFDNQQEANTLIEIVNSEQEIILTHTSEKSFNHMSVGTNKFMPGETYSIYLDDKLYDEFTITDITTVLGSPDKTNPVQIHQ